MKKALATFIALAVLAGCSAKPTPTVKFAPEGRLGAGDSLGLSLHRTDDGLTHARERSYAIHPEN